MAVRFSPYSAIRYNSAMDAIIHLITGIGIIAVLFAIFAESGLLVGFFLPGDSLIFTAGFLVQQGVFSINIHLFVVLLFICAALGDSVGYAFGKRVGPKLFKRPNSRLFRQDNLEAAEAFYKKHGSKTIVLARFVPIVRTFAPIIAGVSNMHYRTFLAYNLVGAALWTATFSYIGFYAGQALTEMGVNVEVAALAIVALSIAPMIIHIIKDPVRRRNMMSGLKRELRVLLGRDKNKT